ncbi:MAG: methionyl-tRNA formyltransferase, partial [Bacteroidetes bacterium]|nr:methionyl-tRNA formyltransferase [Bacteroidota bacterium]
MRIIFFGTPEFAVSSLKKLYDNSVDIAAVVTAPDRPSGRGLKLNATAIKKYALDQSIPVLQPEKLKDQLFLKQLKNFQADLFVVVAFRMLPSIVWQMPSRGTINLHASLLPNYRGAAPINWAIINGEERTGVTTFFINDKIDTGDFLLKKEVEINIDDTAGSLHDTLEEIGSDLLL